MGSFSTESDAVSKTAYIMTHIIEGPTDTNGNDICYYHYGAR
jgi:hypothetical protein